MCSLSCKFKFDRSRQNKADLPQADGRDSEVATEPSPFRLSREVCVPKLESDILHCIITEVISNGDTDSGWTVKYPPIQHFPTATGPSVAIGTTATDEPDGQKGSKTGLGPQRVGTGWAT